MGQSAHPGRLARRKCVRVLLVAAAATGGLTGCGSSLSAATTSLRGVLDVQVVHPDGTTVRGVSGLALRRGDVVRTGPAGRAELATRSRIVYVGSDASVQVDDGAHQALRHGAVVVDADKGAGLILQVAGLEVSVGHGSAVRAERSVADRIATLAGEAGVVSSTGRHLIVPALAQVVVGGDSLPDATTPLRLTDDDAEAHAVPVLVRDDLALESVAHGIDTTGAGTARAVTAAWRGPTSPIPAGVERSEQVLPIVIAAAGGTAGSVARYDKVLSLREAGGSWAVVTRLVGVSTGAVIDTLANWEAAGPAGQVGDVAAAIRAISAAAAESAGRNAAEVGDGVGRGGSSDRGNRSTPGAPQPTPTPTTSSGPAGQVVDTASSTIDTVLSILPTPVPTSSPLVNVPLPSPVAGLITPIAPVLGH